MGVRPRGAQILMYTSFFGLQEKPFAITPDPRYLYMSERHAEALAHLLYGIDQAGGFIQLTGEVGTGKTTVVRSLLGQIPKEAEVALILNPRITPTEFLLTICEELRLAIPAEYRDSVKELVDALNRHLLEAHSRGHRVIVIVDEAQNLSAEVLEQVRLLTNLETPTQKLLQIILIGQPELREVLQRVELRQLAQRITGRYHLSPLTRNETAGYIRHRLRVAGTTNEIFTTGAMREIHRLSGGIPRVINVLSDRALLGAFTREEHRISSALARRASGEIYGRAVLPGWLRWVAAGGAVAGLGLLAFGGWQYLDERAPVAASVANTLQAAVPGPAAAPDAAPAAVSLDRVLRSRTDATTAENAFGRLFALWGASYQPGAADPCEQAAQQGLECVMQRGSWGQLRALNRPAILVLADDAGNEHQLVLSRLEDEHATFNLGTERPRIGIADVSRYWYGDFLLLWKPKVQGVKQLSAGMRGEDVRWLRESLQKVQGVTPSESTPDVFDAELVALVENFQRRHRLAVDGIAGVQTQIVLDTALATPGTPFLSTPEAHGG
jgi:general secretion pathway protein A